MVVPYQFCFSLKELVCQIEVLEKVSFQSYVILKSTVLFYHRDFVSLLILFVCPFSPNWMLNTARNWQRLSTLNSQHILTDILPKYYFFMRSFDRLVLVNMLFHFSTETPIKSFSNKKM